MPSVESAFRLDTAGHFDWAVPLTRYKAQDNGLLIMVYATGSSIDSEVGPALNGLLVLEGSKTINVSAVA